MIFNFIGSEECQCCGSKNKNKFAKLRWEDIEFQWVICEQCSMVYMDPVPDRNSYLNFYKNYFWDHKSGRLKSLSSEQKLDRNEKQVKNWQADSVAAINHRRIPKIVSMLKQFATLDDNTKVLEIGCAWGETLNHLNSQFGSKVFGVEPSDYAVEVLKEKYPFINVIGRTAEDLYSSNKYDGTMDAVVFSHVLENITDQNATLEMVHRLLSQDGLLYIDTCSLYWHKWPLNPYHPFVYTKETISNILIKHGFEIESVKFSPAPGLSLFSTIPNMFMEQDPYITLVARKINKNNAGSQPKTPDAGNVSKQYKEGVRLQSRRNRLLTIRKKLFKRFGVNS